MTDSKSATTPHIASATTPAYLHPVPVPQSWPAPQVLERSRELSVGKWLGEGWRIFSRAPGAFIGASVLFLFFSACSATLLTGPMLSGMYLMAMRAMRGERPRADDIFKGMRFFWRSVLAWLIFAGASAGISSLAANDTVLTVAKYALMPLLGILSAFVYPLMADRGFDIGDALRHSVKILLSQRLPMLWLAGLVFLIISFSGLAGCGVGILITLPFVLCAEAVAYRDLFLPAPSGETRKTWQ